MCHPFIFRLVISLLIFYAVLLLSFTNSPLSNFTSGFLFSVHSPCVPSNFCEMSFLSFCL
uniref:Uncharacterized protein n=1 Tax=Anguilla anguilla TaxID=7936 RepID=A0A0E9SPI8_ANGAN